MSAHAQSKRALRSRWAVACALAARQWSLPVVASILVHAAVIIACCGLLGAVPSALELPTGSAQIITLTLVAPASPNLEAARSDAIADIPIEPQAPAALIEAPAGTDLETPIPIQEALLSVEAASLTAPEGAPDSFPPQIGALIHPEDRFADLAAASHRLMAQTIADVAATSRSALSQLDALLDRLVSAIPPTAAVADKSAHSGAQRDNPVDIPTPEQPMAIEAAGITSGPIAASANKPPPYPDFARRNNQTGEVRIRATIEPDGRVSSALITNSSGFELLDSAALQAVSAWRFQPARAGLRPVRSHADIPIQFVLPR